jgi:tripartite ATP-independent transporter DctP family solute receptor
MANRTIGRRAVLAGAGLAAGALLAAPAIRSAQAASPEFSLKLGDDLPVDHPLNIRLTEAAAQVLERSGGRVEIKLFPNNQLGGDTDMLSQLRTGAIEMLSLSGNILSTMAPVAGLYNLPFAFPDYDHVWAAMDGKLGNYLRVKLDGLGFHALDKHWDNGFRQITSSTRKIEGPADLKGFKIRVPVSPLWLSLFGALGASPTAINWSEAYTAMQTHIVDGQENALPLIETAKLYEVQKYVALTNHMWDGFYLLVNKRAWETLPPDLQPIVADAINAKATEERRDLFQLGQQLQAKLTEQGMQFNQPDNASFRAALTKAGFYAEWKLKFGEEAWALLEETSGKLG